MHARRGGWRRRRRRRREPVDRAEPRLGDSATRRQSPTRARAKLPLGTRRGGRRHPRAAAPHRRWLRRHVVDHLRGVWLVTRQGAGRGDGHRRGAEGPAGRHHHGTTRPRRDQWRRCTRPQRGHRGRKDSAGHHRPRSPELQPPRPLLAERPVRRVLATQLLAGQPPVLRDRVARAVVRLPLHGLGLHPRAASDADHGDRTGARADASAASCWVDQRRSADLRPLLHRVSSSARTSLLLLPSVPGRLRFLYNHCARRVV